MGMRLGSHRFKTLPGLATRPTPGRAREALFNIWRERVRGARWLDLCAGSGAMGGQALVLGAAFVLAIEKAPAACRLIRENWQALPGDREVWCGDVRKLLGKVLALPPFDLIYLDPPYDSDLYAPVLAAIAPGLAPGGQMAVEHRRSQVLPAVVGLTPVDGRTYGETAITFYAPVL